MSWLACKTVQGQSFLLSSPVFLPFNPHILALLKEKFPLLEAWEFPFDQHPWVVVRIDQNPMHDQNTFSPSESAWQVMRDGKIDPLQSVNASKHWMGLLTPGVQMVIHCKKPSSESGAAQVTIYRVPPETILAKEAELVVEELLRDLTATPHKQAPEEHEGGGPDPQAEKAGGTAAEKLPTRTEE